MTFSQIDYYFPFLIFIYGFIVGMVFLVPGLMERAENSLNEKLVFQLKSHRLLSYICLVVGSLWTVQNLLFT